MNKKDLYKEKNKKTCYLEYICIDTNINFYR
ncbi:MAG: hypothetical protein PEPC_00488 [Peptostreptococcus russellii]